MDGKAGMILVPLFHQNLLFMEKILIQIENNIATLSINEPKTLNALNAELLGALETAIAQVEKDENVRVIVLTGVERSFVAGADIQAMSTMDYDGAKAFGNLGAAIFRHIETVSKPVIAAINGFALGGGCELAMACDLRIASSKAKFGQPEVGLGITPGFSGTQRLARLIGFAKAKELIFTGNVITADEALSIGLINRVVEPEMLMEETMKLASTIARQAPIAVAHAKKAINDGWDMTIEEAINLEIEHFAQCFNTEDQKAGMKAFLNKEKTEYNGK